MTVIFILLVFGYPWNEYFFRWANISEQTVKFCSLPFSFCWPKILWLLSVCKNIEIIWNAQVLCIKNLSEVTPFQELFAHIIYQRRAKISPLLTKFCLLSYCLPKLAHLMLTQLLTASEFAHLQCHKISALWLYQYFCSQKAITGFWGTEQRVIRSEQILLFAHRFLLTFSFAHHFLLTENPSSAAT